MVRQHRAFFYINALIFTLGLVLPLAVLWYAFARWGELGSDTQQWSLTTVSAVWVAYWIMRFYFLRFRHHNQVWLVTSRRLVHIYRRNWFKGHTSIVDLRDIEDVDVEKPKPLGWLLGFGNVLCWKGDGRLALAMLAVSKPGQIKEMINDLKRQAPGQ